MIGDEPATRPVTEKPKSPLDKLAETLIEKFGAVLKHIFVGEPEAALIVMDIPPDQVVDNENRLRELTSLSLNVIDLTTYESMHRLAQSGMISLPIANMQDILTTAKFQQQPKRNEHLDKAIKLIEKADHKLKAALLLAGGGFAEEAESPAKDAACIAVAAHATLRGESEPDSVDSTTECLIDEGFRRDTPHGVVSLLMDGEFNGEVTEVVQRTVDWVRKSIARSSV